MMINKNNSRAADNEANSQAKTDCKEGLRDENKVVQTSRCGRPIKLPKRYQ